MTSTTDSTAPATWRPTDTLSVRLVLIRKQLGLSQRAAAEQSGVGFGTWQGMEDGRSPHRMAEQISKISTAFNVDRDWLMWGGALGTETTALWTPMLGVSDAMVAA